MVCRYVCTMKLDSEQKAAVQYYVSQLCEQLRNVVGVVDFDKAVLDAAQVALATMGECVSNENIGGALCDATEDLLKRALPFIEE